MDVLTESIGRTHLSDGPHGPGELEQLLFEPQAESGIADTVLDNIPRYLFRIASPRSDRCTNEIWVRSESAYCNKISSTEDIFFNLNNEKQADIAQILNLHLRWWPKRGLEDNFVSWTSSLLFAIQYIYYRWSSPRDGSSLADIKLYVIDTTRFSRGTFMRDLDLIDIFCDYDENLKSLQSLRNGPDFYFGEYLSQGPLKIENKCQAIPAEVLFQQDRLRRIQPRFAEMPSNKTGNPRLAKAVIRLRQVIWPGFDLPVLSSAEMIDRLQPIEEIMNNIPAGWRFPIAIYFAALIGSESSIKEQETATDNIFFAFFRSESFRHSQVQEEFKSADFNVVATDATPELKQVKKLVRELHKHSLLKKALDRVKAAEASIRHLHIQNEFSGNGRASFVVADDPNKTLAHTGQSLLSKLSTVQMLCREVALALSGDK
ncbi:hypothetical protein E8E15_000190 [Penicillium rubens]|nr:hypothetical protein E8E15_000190 [Penicillium rubens]